MAAALFSSCHHSSARALARFGYTGMLPNVLQVLCARKAWKDAPDIELSCRLLANDALVVTRCNTTSSWRQVSATLQSPAYLEVL